MKLRWLRKARLLSVAFNRFRWYRRLAGGKWERWIVDAPGIHGEWWHDVGEFSRIRAKTLPGPDVILEREMAAYREGRVDANWGVHPAFWGYRPTPLCRGTPIEEDWG